MPMGPRDLSGFAYFVGAMDRPKSLKAQFEARYGVTVWTGWVAALV